MTEPDPVIAQLDIRRFIRDIPLEKITVQRLEKILETTIRLQIGNKQCRLRLNPHHMGYTYINISGVKYPAHRVIKTVATGYNVPGMLVDHLCRNRSCVRLKHLEFVTESENVKRGNAADHFRKLAHKTYCKYGHSLHNALVSLRSSGTVKRKCRTCHMLNERMRRKELRDAKVRRTYN